MLIMSSTSLYFMMRSLAVVEVMDGDAFTCSKIGKVSGVLSFLSLYVSVFHTKNFDKEK